MWTGLRSYPIPVIHVTTRNIKNSPANLKKDGIEKMHWKGSIPHENLPIKIHKLNKIYSIFHSSGRKLLIEIRNMIMYNIFLVVTWLYILYLALMNLLSCSSSPCTDQLEKRPVIRRRCIRSSFPVLWCRHRARACGETSRCQLNKCGNLKGLYHYKVVFLFVS
jgi:hypothetical protein